MPRIAVCRGIESRTSCTKVPGDDPIYIVKADPKTRLYTLTVSRRNEYTEQRNDTAGQRSPNAAPQ